MNKTYTKVDEKTVAVQEQVTTQINIEQIKFQISSLESIIQISQAKLDEYNVVISEAKKVGVDPAVAVPAATIIEK